MSIVKTKVHERDWGRTEHWTAETYSELLDEFERQESQWPYTTYGTVMYDVRLDPTGLLWHATFYRRLCVF